MCHNCYAVILLTFIASFSQAAPLISTITGIGNGVFAGQPFQNTRFTIIGTGNTDGIFSPLPSPEYPDYFSSAVDVSASVVVDGLGGGTFSNRVVLSIGQTLMAGGLGDFGLDRAILFVRNPIFSDYYLTNSIEPVGGSLIINPGTAFSTSSGDFTLTSVANATVEVALVPEPACGILLAVPLLRFLIVGRHCFSDV